MLHRLLYWSVWWLLLFGLWLLFAGRLSRSEVWVGAFAALLGVAAGIGAQNDHLFRIRVRWLSRLPRAVWQVFPDSARVLWVAVKLLSRRRLVGQFVTVPYPIEGEDAWTPSREALHTLGLSLGPNTYVVQVERARGRILMHQLDTRIPPPSVEPLP